jgi:site-specific DNA-cytosine methylase
MKKGKKFTFIDLFAGCGGSTEFFVVGAIRVFGAYREKIQ